MVKKWCINCQTEREHAPLYSGSCECNCDHNCVVCGRKTLASITVNLDDTGYSEVKQMIGEAQRIAQRTGRRGDIEVVKYSGSGGDNCQVQVLIYNTYSGSFRVDKR